MGLVLKLFEVKHFIYFSTLFWVRVESVNAFVREKSSHLKL